MALTFKRWLGIVVVLGILIVAVLQRSDRGPDATATIGRDSLWRNALRASGSLSGAVQQLRVLELVDSVNRAASSNDTARLIIDPRLPAMIREPLGELAKRSGVLSSPTLHETRVMIVRDVLDSLRGADVNFGFFAHQFLLPRDTGEVCTVLLRVRPRNPARFSYRGWREGLERRAAVTTFGGPCAWYQAFGKPGTHVQQWLDRGGWNLATFGPGAMDTTRWRPDDWAWLHGMTDDERLRFYTSIGGYRCVTGDASRCADEVLFVGRADTHQGQRIRSIERYRWNDGLGPTQRQFLAGLLATVGPERFARFWQSDEPVPDAFRRHVGEDVGEYTLRWAQRYYGANHRRGPNLSFAGALFGTAIAGSALAAALLKRRRRELA